MHADSGTSRTASRALDALNFFSADVRDGVGPFLAVWLIHQDGWDAQKIGWCMTVAGLASIAVQTPAGALIDATRRKRAWLAAAIVAISLACVMLGFTHSFAGVMVSQVVTGLAAALVAPALAGITLGLVGPRGLSHRQARNEAWNHGGNVVAALLAMALSARFSIEAVFYANAVLGVFSLLAAMAIPARAIDHEVARGHAPEQKDAAATDGWRSLLLRPGFAAFVLACTLFHFANAAMLPLAGQVLALDDAANAGTWMSACILIAQAVMVPTAIVAGRLLPRFGWGRLLIVGFCVLPLRGVLLTLGQSPPWILLVQALDGLGAGLFGVLAVVAVADLTRGSGRFNAAQGLALTAVGLGAALSPGAAGTLVQHASYPVAFGALAVLAVGAVLLLAFSLRQQERGAGPGPDAEAVPPAPPAAVAPLPAA